MLPDLASGSPLEVILNVLLTSLGRGSWEVEVCVCECARARTHTHTHTHTLCYTQFCVYLMPLIATLLKSALEPNHLLYTQMLCENLAPITLDVVLFLLLSLSLLL